MDENSLDLQPHPLQAEFILPVELYIKANVVPSGSTRYEGVEPRFSIAYSDYDRERKQIHIRVQTEMGKEDDEGSIPFHLRVELLGSFIVDETRFPVDRLTEWAQRNSVFLFYPYLREHVFALTARCGFLPALLPLITVPTFPLAPEPNKVD
jgi:preprotein translocase subunit SecB